MFNRGGGGKIVIIFPVKIILLTLLFPILIVAIGISHLELFLKLGSKNDPLGYTIIIKK
jgi:hypothetical protein